MKFHFDQFTGKKILITGGLGFVGSNLARSLVGLGASVTLVDSLDPSCGGNRTNISDISDQIDINIADVRDLNTMIHFVKGKHFLFNLAGRTSHIDSMINPLEDMDINCRAQIAILESCRKENPEIRVVFASTRQIYGKPERLPVDESHGLHPVDVNGINKMAGESFHMLYSRVHGICACSLRLTNTYGPGMRIKDARQTFLGVWIRRALEGQTFEIWEGKQRRDFTYIDDCVGALLLAANCPKANGEVFNLGGSEVVSLKEVGNMIREIEPLARFELCSYPPDRKTIDIGDYFADFSKIRDRLGWSPQIDLRSGLRKTIDYYRKNLTSYI
jgi:UDP-glucose 4-epimerase